VNAGLTQACRLVMVREYGHDAETSHRFVAGLSY
jgi:hypothetical protein